MAKAWLYGSIERSFGFNQAPDLLKLDELGLQGTAQQGSNDLFEPFIAKQMFPALQSLPIVQSMNGFRSLLIRF